jgi:hypothetical protein
MAKEQEWHKTLAFLIVNNPGLNKKEIAIQLHKTPSTVSKALAKPHVKKEIERLKKILTKQKQEKTRDFANIQAELIELSYNHMIETMNKPYDEDTPGLLREKTDIAKACLKGFGEFVDKSEVKNTNTVIKVTRKKRNDSN